MLPVGLTGGLASGKTFVGHALEDLGCHLIEADELGHQVLLPGAEAYDAVIHDFGDEILDQDGHIDRHKLGDLVSERSRTAGETQQSGSSARRRARRRIIAEIAKRDPAAIVVVEAAILVETGSYKKFDRLIVAVCTPEQQIERALSTRYVYQRRGPGPAQPPVASGRKVARRRLCNRYFRHQGKYAGTGAGRVWLAAEFISMRFRILFITAFLVGGFLPDHLQDRLGTAPYIPPDFPDRSPFWSGPDVARGAGLSSDETQ